MTKIVLVTEALTTGGAETFVLRLAEALKTRCCSPTLVVLRGDLVNFPLVQRLARELQVVFVKIPYLRWVMRLDGLLFRVGVKFSFQRWLQAYQLRTYLRKVRPDVVHAHLLTSDLVASRACREFCIPWVSTMHGDYLAFEVNGGSRAARISDFGMVVHEIEQTVGHMVCITEQQQLQLSRLMPSLAETGRISKIYNGYAASDGDSAQDDLPESLSEIPKGAFVIGMVARGIQDKGWDVLIAAFEALVLADTWLVLVGDGEYLQQVRLANQNPRIVFCGNVVDPLRYVARFDVACLPSQIPTESLPTVVIEYMYLGKPVIATDVGEIPKMLDAASDAPAGLLIELGETPAMADQMKTALLKLYSDKAERCRLGANAARAVKKFDMDVCVNAYLDIYAKVKAHQ